MPNKPLPPGRPQLPHDVRDGGTSPAERILDAALTCMARDGLEATGIREIAREAGVNGAAINYYFRSKDNLIALALERSLESAFDDILSDLDRLRAEQVPLGVALERVIDDYVRHVRRYPRLAYAHLREALVEQRYDGPVVLRLNAFLEQLAQRLAPAGGGERSFELRLRLVQAWSNLISTGILPQLFEPFLPLDFDDEQVRASYVRRLLEPLRELLEPAQGG